MEIYANRVHVPLVRLYTHLQAARPQLYDFVSIFSPLSNATQRMFEWRSVKIDKKIENGSTIRVCVLFYRFLCVAAGCERAAWTRERQTNWFILRFTWNESVVVALMQWRMPSFFFLFLNWLISNHSALCNLCAAVSTFVIVQLISEMYMSCAPVCSQQKN